MDADSIRQLLHVHDAFFGRLYCGGNDQRPGGHAGAIPGPHHHLGDDQFVAGADHDQHRPVLHQPDRAAVLYEQSAGWPGERLLFHQPAGADHHQLSADLGVVHQCGLIPVLPGRANQ